MMVLLGQPVADKGIDAVVRGAEASQLHPLAVDDLLCVTVAPLDGDIAVCVGIDEHIEGAVAVELREEGDGGGDLAEDGGDFGLDLGFGLFLGLWLLGRRSGGAWGCVFLLLCLRLGGGGFRGL